MRLSLCLNPCLSFYLFIQLIDLSELFLSTEIEFLRSALSQSEGSVQAICVPSGTVRKNLSSPSCQVLQNEKLLHFKQTYV